MSSIVGPNIGRVKVDFQKLAKAKIGELSAEVAAFARETVNDAKLAVPRGSDSRLLSAITANKINEYQYELVAQTKYAAYVEFGTKTKVRIPQGAKDIAESAKEAAAQAKRDGKSGSIADMEKSIRRWVEKKGIAGSYSVKTRKLSKSKESRSQVEAAVFAIMRHILRVGIEPQPYFYPAIIKNRRKLNTKIRKIIRK